MNSREPGSQGAGEPGIDRREFMFSAAVGLSAAWLPDSLAPWLPVEKLRRIGIELYTVRRELAKDPEGTLAKVAAIGYQEVEFAGYPPGTAKSLRAMLERL